MKAHFLKTKFIVLTLIIIASCSKEDSNIISKEAFVVGFDPCTVANNYRLGYVIITEDLNDTLLTYNLSDVTKKIPASILLNTNDTLYKIPEDYFENFENSIYFPNSSRFEYKLTVNYKFATEEEMVFNLCSTDLISLTAPQVMIKSISK